MTPTTTLFSDIQRLFERTYAAVGINLEDCLIDRHRCGQLSRLAGASARELSELARTFLRRVNGNLHIGIYYSNWLIEQLERNDPRRSLSDSNIRQLIAFVEEINHALHAALAFRRGGVQHAAYSAAKGALVGLTRALARRFREKATVNALGPGVIDTPMPADIIRLRREKLLAEIPFGRFGRPEEVATVIRFLLSDDSSYITGQTINVDGGAVMS